MDNHKLTHLLQSKAFRQGISLYIFITLIIMFLTYLGGILVKTLM